MLIAKTLSKALYFSRGCEPWIKTQTQETNIYLDPAHCRPILRRLSFLKCIPGDESATLDSLVEYVLEKKTVAPTLAVRPQPPWNHHHFQEASCPYLWPTRPIFLGRGVAKNPTPTGPHLGEENFHEKTFTEIWVRPLLVSMPSRPCRRRWRLGWCVKYIRIIDGP